MYTDKLAASRYLTTAPTAWDRHPYPVNPRSRRRPGTETIQNATPFSTLESESQIGLNKEACMKNDIGSFQQEIQSKIRSSGLIGNYQILRKIGEGSFSSVYLAVHVMTRHEVVLKSADKSQLNLASEIANMSLLSHPHIVRLYEYIVMPDKVWLVLEYCGGEELLNHLVMLKVIRPSQACRLFAQLAGAVAYAHQLHCAHRDLKLENVLLDEDGNIKLGDFGFTRSYLPRTMLETVCGTESYMAPELVLRQKYNPEAADVWSLGVILYALIYGKLPFDEDNTAATVKKIVEEDPDFPPVPKGEYLVEIARKMLRKQPNQRPKVIEMLDELKEPGKQQRQLLKKIMNHPESSHIFSSREERTVLKGMKALSIDLHLMASSVLHHKCDPLHGLWFTALNRQRILNKQAASEANSTANAALHRRKSKASIRSTKSLGSQKKAQQQPNGFPVLDHHGSDQLADTTYQTVSDSCETQEDNRRASFASCKTPDLEGYSQTFVRLAQPDQSDDPAFTNTAVPEEAPTPSLGPQSEGRVDDFIKRRSTGRLKRTVGRFVSALKINRNSRKETLMTYYKSVLSESKTGVSALPNSGGKGRSLTLPSSSGGGEKLALPSLADETSSEYRRMVSPILDLGRTSPQSSRRHSTLSFTSSLSDTQGKTAPAASSPVHHQTPSQNQNANPQSSSQFSRQMSTYSQISQMSQLSQSSVEVSQLIVDDSPKSINNPSSRMSKANAWKFAGVAQPVSMFNAASTPPGTPLMSRQRAGRLISVKEKIPSKIDEGDDEHE